MSLRKFLPARSVHLRIIPRPANLSESREIFRVLQRFGEISMYKSLRYEYHNPADNIALAIYRSADAAQHALDASPIRFALEKVVPTDSENTQPLNAEEQLEENLDLHNASPNTGIDEMLRPSTLSARSSLPPTSTPRDPDQTPQTHPPSMPFAAPTISKTATKWFQVTVDQSRAVHQDFVERQPYWKQFTPMKSMAQEDLSKRVPHPGLSDVSKRPPNAHRTPKKVLRLMSEYVDRRMVSLREVWEAEQDKSRGKVGEGGRR
ncbi:hypothetical protein P153DRAFT_432568 [Dothidotthia symphoricarpi CBS 119687]|uniref:Uncharacterized protein n=1 Tax=Dothidotthia symphoricarpi CBS 119687 TaxID=1392245 RepID=A0A6A6ABH1_9PLEO|nr:uncharacterized protein P153DRAFT_432568 [Dothidotthia symphoricarpi CBS 119687]KAF2128207.1 hypothetical protein P153DRAFT_432568 [Dothidotthia symphoricarpi CBS 119687]